VALAYVQRLFFFQSLRRVFLTGFSLFSQVRADFNPNRSLDRLYIFSSFLLSVFAISAFFSASCPHPCLAIARYVLTSLTLLWLGRASELSLLSLYATVASDAANLLKTNTNLP
jgi:hypothetical protein